MAQVPGSDSSPRFLTRSVIFAEDITGGVGETGGCIFGEGVPGLAPEGGEAVSKFVFELDGDKECFGVTGDIPWAASLDADVVRVVDVGETMDTTGDGEVVGTGREGADTQILVR